MRRNCQLFLYNIKPHQIEITQANENITQAHLKTTQANEHYNNINKKDIFLETTQAPQKTTQANEKNDNTTQGAIFLKRLILTKMPHISRIIPTKNGV